MEKTFIGVREVDEETFRKFRAMVIENKMKLGYALSQAMRKMIEENMKKKILNKKPALLDIKPFDFGKGTENLSENIDKIVYGD
ncbi:hypothetical protein J4429_02400 [Candidatus Pacearchaeota archaeon]|nr:hypothetical protein [Candidatus Pacearchaeota archaeon]